MTRLKELLDDAKKRNEFHAEFMWQKRCMDTRAITGNALEY